MPSWSTEINHSLYGRDLGMNFQSSAESGSTRGRYSFVAGPDAYRVGKTTADSTSVQLHPYGISFLTTGTSRVFTLNPPVPGVEKVIVSTCASGAWVKCRNAGERIQSTQGGSSMNTMYFTSFSFVKLLGLTTARWLLVSAPLTTASLDLSTTT